MQGNHFRLVDRIMQEAPGSSVIKQSGARFKGQSKTKLWGNPTGTQVGNSFSDRAQVIPSCVSHSKDLSLQYESWGSWFGQHLLSGR